MPLKKSSKAPTSQNFLTIEPIWTTIFLFIIQVLIAINIFGYQTECHKVEMALSAEKRLIKQLMDNYTKDGLYGRPIKAMNKKLKVGYGISLIQIMNVDAKDQVLTTNVWCKYKWRDESLQWNPIHHGNITIVRVPISSIWKPDFVLYNYADERLNEHRHVMALIDPFGYVTYIPPVIFKSSCAIDTTNFPFDEQHCHMKFGSWTYNGNSLDPYFIDNKEYIELSEYVPSQEWVILEHNGKKNVQYYGCCPEPYADLTFFLKVRRRATFYSYTLVLPCVLLSFITMVLFMLPPETPAKMLLGINIYIAFFTLLLLLKESTPPTSKRIPILGAYYCFNMTMTTVSTFLCAILVDMHFRADKRNPPSRWLTFIVIEVIARALLINIPPSILTLIKSQRLESLKRKRKTDALKRQRAKKSQTLVTLREGLLFIPENLCDCVVVKAPKTPQTRISLCSDEEQEGDDLKEDSKRKGKKQQHHRRADDDEQEKYYENLANRRGIKTKREETSPTSSETSCYHRGTGKNNRISDSLYTTENRLRAILGDRQLYSSPEGGRNDDDNDLPLEFLSPSSAAATYSPLKRGVFVGATVDRRTGHSLSKSAATTPPSSRRQCRCNISFRYDEYADDENPPTVIYENLDHHPLLKNEQHGRSSTSLGAGQKQRLFPSTSFDLKHYNKFDMYNSSPPLSSAKGTGDNSGAMMEPGLEKLEQQVDMLGRAAVRLSGSQNRKKCEFQDLATVALVKRKAKSNKSGYGQDYEQRAAAELKASPKTVKSEIHLIREMLKKFTKRLVQKEIGKRNAEAWRMISMVLDRVFLFGYIISMIISLTVLFPQRPPELPDQPRYPNGTLIDDPK